RRKLPDATDGRGQRREMISSCRAEDAWRRSVCPLRHPSQASIAAAEALQASTAARLQRICRAGPEAGAAELQSSQHTLGRLLAGAYAVRNADSGVYISRQE